MLRTVLFTILLVAVQPLFSQEIKGVVGRWAIINITPEQAREKAIEEAKKEALRKAGIEETIKASDILSTISSTDKYWQLFSSFSSIELHGAVTDYTIIIDEQEKNSVDGKLYAVVMIDAKVKRYRTTTDSEFKIEVNGLQSNGYKNGDAINFSVTPNKEGYLKIFLFENTAASFVFPNKYEQNEKFTAKKAVQFPVAGIEYIAEKSTDEPMEHNLLLFVYTKSDIPFYGVVSYKNILNWVNNIEPNERDVVIEDIMITE
ncbi:MAG: DUF4384 domain-containing protein [Prevotellaceae bacterium]|jgi:hypothetical protein|nr:DUF4384 domain-containing protein [Prevotellaceae bacterium]